MELLFNYYHGLLTQNQTLKNTNTSTTTTNNNNNNLNNTNCQYNEVQQVITPEFLTHFFTLLANLSYLEQFKSQENNYTSTSSINQSIITPSPYQHSLASTHCDDALASIKCESDEINCVSSVFSIVSFF